MFTPVLGAAATASWPCAVSCLTSFYLMRPVPPITTIFMIVLFFMLAIEHVESEDVSEMSATHLKLWPLM